MSTLAKSDTYTRILFIVKIDSNEFVGACRLYFYNQLFTYIIK